MSLFGLRPLPSGPATVPGVPHLPDLEDQRRLIAKARRDARAWLIRCVLMIVVAAFAVRTGLLFFGVVLFLLALLVLQLSHSNYKQAAALERKLELLEAAK
jgi:hypothetical protein